MKLGIRSKLFFTSVALIFCVGVISALYLRGEMRQGFESRIEAELVGQANVAREMLEMTNREVVPSAVMATRLAAALNSRVTIVAPSGDVIGDAYMGTDLLKKGQPESYRNRPEVIDALAQGRGTARWSSSTLSADMLYVAVPFYQPGGEGRSVVRVAKPLKEVDAVLSRLQMLIVAAGIVGLIVAILMSALASHLMSRTLRRVAESARAIAGDSVRGQGRRHRIEIPGTDEIGGLAGSINRLVDEIEATVGALATERARLEAVLEGMNEAVVVLDREQRISLLNATAMKLFGLTQAAVGKPLLDYLRAPAIYKLLANPEGARTCEFELSSDPPRHVLVQVSRQKRDEDGCILVMLDVTSVRKLETVRRDFVANVSHELRTPVSVIRANAETLLDGAISDPVHSARLLDALQRNATRLSRIIDDLLDLSRLEAGRFALERHDVSVAEVVDNAVGAMEQSAEEKNIELSVDVPATLEVRGDDKGLDQILVNYLDNAIKYTPPGGKVCVTARALPGGTVRVEVIDNGPGIAPHHQARIFERFYRVDPGRSRDMGGTGLGLSIVKHLAVAMSGDAGMDAAQPHGSCFWVSLPSASRAVSAGA